MGRIRRATPLQFILLVPFRSSMQAEIACHLLAFSAEPQPEATQREVRVSGSRLAIRLSADNLDQLRLSISSCVQELSVLIETMQHILPPFFFVSPRTMNGG
ncbi:EKC/KEOPS complex subunit Lage3-like [Eptesicus fuscus]|uniref:EKC/KEOPS complex subunit Lage3-like n=1 Tax=Eptesicus fuscus TaxID=29078 RepID=UPI00101A4743|nr:EKC/KEOPS complex subunit Lage3-like [Eptesicus fuscus]